VLISLVDLIIILSTIFFQLVACFQLFSFTSAWSLKKIDFVKAAGSDYDDSAPLGEILLPPSQLVDLSCWCVTPIPADEGAEG
jgi:hypothetical protein